MMRVREITGRAGLGFGPIPGNRGMYSFCSHVFRDLWGKCGPVSGLRKPSILSKINMFPSFP